MHTPIHTYYTPIHIICPSKAHLPSISDWPNNPISRKVHPGACSNGPHFPTFTHVRYAGVDPGVGWGRTPPPPPFIDKIGEHPPGQRGAHLNALLVHHSDPTPPILSQIVGPPMIWSYFLPWRLPTMTSAYHDVCRLPLPLCHDILTILKFHVRGSVARATVPRCTSSVQFGLVCWGLRLSNSNSQCTCSAVQCRCTASVQRTACYVVCFDSMLPGHGHHVV